MSETRRNLKAADNITSPCSVVNSQQNKVKGDKDEKKNFIPQLPLDYFSDNEDNNDHFIPQLPIDEEGNDGKNGEEYIKFLQRILTDRIETLKIK